MVFQIVAGYTVFDTSLFDFGQVLIYPDGKGPDGTAHVLFFTWACNEVHCEPSNTCGEVFHRVDMHSDCGHESLRLASTTNVV